MIRTNSILLNSPTQSPRLSPTATYSISSSSCSSSDLNLQMQRRIRFAPLPNEQITTTPPAAVDSKPKPKPKSSFFRSIFKRSPPPEDVTILRRSRSPQPHDFGSPLTRANSTPIRQPKRSSSSSSDSKPRSSANSLGSGGGRHAMPMPSTRFTTPSLPTKSARRMLNGRVYGSKRQPPANPFANVRDEPEFVEWGYGGMGSVTGSSDSKYSVLAKGAPALLSHTQARVTKTPVERNDGVGVPAPDDEDDGSGMGWVKKRKLERERLAREKQAAELISALDTDSRRTSTDRSSTMDSTSTRLSTLAASSAPTTPLSTTDTLPPQDYILQAVRLSPHLKHTSPVVNTSLSFTHPPMNRPSTASESTKYHRQALREDDSDESEVDRAEVRLLPFPCSTHLTF
ncbi:uncharacterized protein HD556DRAFT_1348132 [Suillus plorans]|uniref:Uncharacterized protein n=1 Tax=Suillus plorans TaxID=116603 RepID=A0A9P7DNY8_9AGAM|nr:uncharacterized protein HD556DRAFT_1348132 [Suillus plorans]KAG1799482.1 hypothetical protein HD556DRAFT_1348132 [Suillus plorans]